MALYRTLLKLIAAMTAATLAGCARTPGQTVRGTRSDPFPKLTREFAIPVLMYHRVAPLTPSEGRNELVRDLTVLPEDFDDQVRYLRENGYEMLSVYDVQEALLKDEPLPEKAVALTFDDGYRDNFDHAFPILQKYGASGTIFLVKNTVDTDRHLTWDQIFAMRPAGVRYGSHTVSHADLPLLDDTRLDAELQASKNFFESKLKEPVTSLAYPAGRFDDRVVDHVREAGYLTAWKKGGGPVRPGDDLLRLPRVRVHGKTSMADFERKVKSGVWAIRISRERQKVNS